MNEQDNSDFDDLELAEHYLRGDATQFRYLHVYSGSLGVHSKYPHFKIKIPAY